jgi:hypothetical protein
MNFEGISENMPVHFFVIDRRLEPFCIYLYAPEFSELNKRYLNIVHQRFLKRSHKNISDKLVTTQPLH